MLGQRCTWVWVVTGRVPAQFVLGDAGLDRDEAICGFQLHAKGLSQGWKASRTEVKEQVLSKEERLLAAFWGLDRRSLVIYAWEERSWQRRPATFRGCAKRCRRSALKKTSECSNRSSKSIMRAGEGCEGRGRVA